MSSADPKVKIPRERLPYSAIVDRPKRKLPGGARVVVWPIVNVEDWDIGRAMPRVVIPAPTNLAVLPDIANWGWHEYGMRVGFWRMKQALDSRGIRASLSINGRVCESYPRVAQAALEAKWEFVGHNYIQVPLPARRRSAGSDSPDHRGHRTLHRIPSQGLDESRASPRPWPRSITWPRPAYATSATGRLTICPATSPPLTAPWWPCLTRSKSTTSS